MSRPSVDELTGDVAMLRAALEVKTKECTSLQNLLTKCESDLGVARVDLQAYKTVLDAIVKLVNEGKL